MSTNVLVTPACALSKDKIDAPLLRRLEYLFGEDGVVKSKKISNFLLSDKRVAYQFPIVLLSPAKQIMEAV